MYIELRSHIARELGFGQDQWTTSNSCYGRLDIEDLFDNHNLEVELHVVVTRKPISKEDALEEYKQYLMSDKMTIPRTKEQVDSLTFKEISRRLQASSNTK